MSFRRFPTRALAAATAGILATLGAAPDAPAQEPAGVTYTVTFPRLAAHAARVQAVVPTGGAASVDLMMPIWSPGYYKVENYANNVDSVTATDASGRTLALSRPRSNHWLVQTGGAGSITVSYRVKADRKFVTADWVGDSLIVLCGAPTFMVPANGLAQPATVDLVLPQGWTSMTSMDTASDHVADHYEAADYDELVDSPIVAGNLQTVQFDVDGKTHVLVDAGAVDDFSGEQAGRALLRVVSETYRFWGFLPYKRYVFLNLFRPGGGGLEHKSSTLLTAKGNATSTPELFDGWLTFVAHEYFHAFNVKRLRPKVLGPFDYEGTPKTPSLWIAEGLTTYYADLMVARAGVARQQDWLDWMSKLIADLQNTPGRRVQTLSAASLDVWRSESSGVGMDKAKTVSYYTKGPVVGLLLDAHIRALTGGTKSLDDVMRAEYARFSGDSGYTPEEFQAVADSAAGTNLDDWFHRALDTTQELDYQEMLDWYGLKFAGWGNRTQRWALEPVEKPTPDQLAHLRDLLRADTPPMPAGAPVPAIPHLNDR